MKLIIDIPKDTKNRLCFGITYQKDIQTICEALNNGTPFDKLRAEIDEQKNHRCFDDDDMCIYKAGLIDALEIIDRYRNEVSK